MLTNKYKIYSKNIEKFISLISSYCPKLKVIPPSLTNLKQIITYGSENIQIIPFQCLHKNFLHKKMQNNNKPTLITTRKTL